MKIHVDRDNCEAQGVCVRLCAQMFELDDDDNLIVLADDVPADCQDAVRRAVAKCPKQALRIEDGQLSV